MFRRSCLAYLAFALACTTQATPPSAPDEILEDAAPPKPDAAAAADRPGATDVRGEEPIPDARLADAAMPPSADGGTLPPQASPGCADQAGLPEGVATIMVGATPRSYTLRLPAGYGNTRAWPLVLALHPNGNAGMAYWDGNGVRPLRRVLRDKAILVLPLARGTTGNWDWRGDVPADLAYFEALLTQLQTKLCIDTRRIFSMGFSGGGSFSGVLACMRKDIRAFAAGGSVIYFDQKACVGTPPAWITIGEGELQGRTGFRDFWRSRNGCSATTSPVAPSPCVAYACPPATPVHYCQHPGDHEWPAFGTEAAWAFFSQF